MFKGNFHLNAFQFSICLIILPNVHKITLKLSLFLAFHSVFSEENDFLLPIVYYVLKSSLVPWNLCWITSGLEGVVRGSAMLCHITQSLHIDPALALPLWLLPIQRTSAIAIMAGGTRCAVSALSAWRPYNSHCQDWKVWPDPISTEEVTG